MKRLHTIKVDDAEWAEWKLAAGSGTVSDWIRHCVNILSKPNPEHLYKTMVKNTTEAIDSIPNIEAVGDFTPRKPCKHGLLFCKKCK